MTSDSHPTPDRRTPVDHLCVVCCKRTYENVGIKIDGAWYCFTCGSKKRNGEPIQPTSKNHTVRVAQGYVHEDYGRGSTVREATATERLLGAEIERLTRERDEAVTGYSVRDAEVTGLLARCAQHDKEMTAFCAERDRLKAALESIKEMANSFGGPATRIEMVARKALSGEPGRSDETKDGPSRIDAGLARKLRALSAQFTGETHDLLQMAAIRLESRPPSKAGENHGAG